MFHNFIHGISMSTVKNLFYCRAAIPLELRLFTVWFHILSLLSARLVCERYGFTGDWHFATWLSWKDDLV